MVCSIFIPVMRLGAEEDIHGEEMKRKTLAGIFIAGKI